MLSKKHFNEHRTPIFIVKHVEYIEDTEKSYNIIETFSLYSFWHGKLKYSTLDLFNLYELLKPNKLSVDNPCEYVTNNNDTFQNSISKKVCAILNPDKCWWFYPESNIEKCNRNIDYVPTILEEANSIVDDFNRQLDNDVYNIAIKELPSLEESLRAINDEMEAISARRSFLKEKYGKNIDWQEYYRYYAPKEENELSRRYKQLSEKRSPLSLKVSALRKEKKHSECRALINFYYHLTLQNELDLKDPLPHFFFLPLMEESFYALDLALFMNDKRFIECSIRCGNTDTNWPIDPLDLLEQVARSTNDFYIYEKMIQKYNNDYQAMLEKGKNTFGNYHYSYLILRHYLLAVQENRLDEVIKLFNTKLCLYDLINGYDFQKYKINPYTLETETSEEDTVPDYISPELKAYLDETIVKGFVERREKEANRTGSWVMDHIIDSRTGRTIYLNAQDDPDIYTGPL